MRKNFTIAILAFSINAFAQIPTTGLVAYYPFNGNANDESGNANNGTVNGATLTTDRFGNANSAYSADGINDYIVFPRGNLDNFGLNDFSLCIWFKNNGDNSGTIYDYRPFNIGINTINQSQFSNTNLFFRTDYEMNNNLEITNNSLFDNSWHLLIFSRNSSGKEIFIDGKLINSNPFVNDEFQGVTELYIFCENATNTFLKGSLDDIRIYNRTLTTNEINNIFHENGYCVNESKDIVKEHFVSDIDFQSSSPKTYFEVTDSLISAYGCDSVVNRYSKYIYEPTYCSVTDTLIIDVTLTEISATTVNSIKIYPNPAKDFVIVNTGNYNQMSNYTIKIENMLGQTVFSNLVNQAEFQINVNDFGGEGTYFVKIIDNLSNVVTTRKIVIQ